MIDNAAALSPLPIEDAPLFGVFEGLRACERIPQATMSMRLARQSIVAGLALSGVAMIFAASVSLRGRKVRFFRKRSTSQ